MAAEETQYRIDEEINSDYEVNAEDFFRTTLDEYDQFDLKARSKGEGYIAPNFPMLNECLEGLDEGLYIIAAESNSGKSATLLNLFCDYVLNPKNDLVGLYFTLDDSRQEIIPRIMAMHSLIPISVCSKPMRYESRMAAAPPDVYQQYAEMLEKRQEALEWIRTTNEHFKVVDTEKVRNGEQVIDYCEKMLDYIHGYDTSLNLIVAIDSLADLKFPSMGFRAGDEYAEMSYAAEQVKDWAMQILKCPIFTTYHLKKIDQSKRPTIADLRGAGRLIYEASVVFLAHNDVGRNGDNAAICVIDEATKETVPVIELQWAKNKKSSFKGRTYYRFYPNCSKIYECSPEEKERFDSLIYSSK